VTSLRRGLRIVCFFAFAIVASADPPRPPGVVIDQSPASSQQYIGSPSLAVLPSGEYLASHDFFGPGSTRQLTIVFISKDKGATWQPRAKIDGQWWSSLFVHRDAVYIMGTTSEYGFLGIRRSTDSGETWTTPADANSGLLLNDGKYHTAPVPVVVHAGRIWRAMEDAQGPDGWGHHFRAFMMSAPEDGDLLDAKNWTFSNRIGWDPQLLDGKFGGWLEGNAVVAPDGKIVDILRVDHPDANERAAILEVSADGKQMNFDAAKDFIDFPGGAKKFTIRRDPNDGSYWSLANYVPPDKRGPKPATIRNTLALINSKDLRSWEIRKILLDHPDPVKHGFQYADWLFDGEDIIAVVRTAFDDEFGGAVRQHDANYMTFHRFTGFRK